MAALSHVQKWSLAVILGLSAGRLVAQAVNYDLQTREMWNNKVYISWQNIRHVNQQDSRNVVIDVLKYDDNGDGDPRNDIDRIVGNIQGDTAHGIGFGFDGWQGDFEIGGAPWGTVEPNPDGSATLTLTRSLSVGTVSAYYTMKPGEALINVTVKAAPVGAPLNMSWGIIHRNSCWVSNNPGEMLLYDYAGLPGKILPAQPSYGYGTFTEGVGYISLSGQTSGFAGIASTQRNWTIGVVLRHAPVFCKLEAVVCMISENGGWPFMRCATVAAENLQPGIVHTFEGIIYGDSTGTFQGLEAASIINDRPISSAGPDQAAPPGTSVVLDGTGSTDPDNDYPLSYQWEIVEKPSGSSATLSNPTDPRPSFTPDLLGAYVVQLVVADGRGLQGAPDTVRVDTSNTPPVADAGENLAAYLVGVPVQVDGNGSFDDDGHTLAYLWTIVEKPEGSCSDLSNPSSPATSFTPDLYGVYRVQLVVSDAYGGIDTDVILVSFGNIRPVAITGVYPPVQVATRVDLHGAGRDANGDPLSYQWAMVSRPGGSLTELVQPLLPDAFFVPDRPGDYVLSLVVCDGLLFSEPVTVTVTAFVNGAVVSQKLISLAVAVQALSLEDFKNKQLQKTLGQKINSVMAMIDAAEYFDARQHLVHDILAKTDGCAVGSTPDRNDWVVTCAGQAALRPLLMETIAFLELLL